MMYPKVLIILTLCFTFSFCNKEDKTESKNKTETSKTESSNNDLKITDDFIIDYDLVGRLNGKMTIYRKGNKLKQDINSEIMGMQSKNEIYVLDNFVFTVTDMGGKKFGAKTDLQNYNMQKQTGETITDFTQFEKFLESKKVVGSENILGYICDIYDLGNNVALSVNNKRYILKIKAPEFMATATKLETNPTFSANEFELPSDINFKNINPQGTKNETLDSLLKEFKK